MKRTIVVAISGASGVAYSVRLLEVLLAVGCDVHLTISAAGQVVLKQELGLSVDLDNFNPAMLMLDAGEKLRDPKLRLLGSLAGISGDSSNVLGMGAGQPGKLRYHHFGTPWPRSPAARFRPTAWWFALAPAARSARSSTAPRQPDPSRRRSPPEGAAEADPGAPRNPALPDAASQHDGRPPKPAR